MNVKVPEEQILYATILYYGSLFGIVFLAVSFGLYVSGVLPSYVPPQEIPGYWTHETHEYLERTKIPTGWGWIKLVWYGDLLNLLALAFLASITIVCYLAVIPTLAKKRDMIYITFALAEVLILLLAASGILQAHH